MPYVLIIIVFFVSGVVDGAVSVRIAKQEFLSEKLCKIAAKKIKTDQDFGVKIRGSSNLRYFSSSIKADCLRIQ